MKVFPTSISHISIERVLIASIVCLTLFLTFGPQQVQAKSIEPERNPQAYDFLSLVENSVSPATIISGENATFQTEVFNSSDGTINLTESTSFSLLVQGDQTVTGTLLGPQEIPSHQQAKLIFSYITIPEVSTPESVTASLNLIGTDSVGSPYQQTLPVENQLTIHPNQPGLVEVPGSYEPTEPSRQSRLIFWVELENTTDCPIQIGSDSEMVISSESKWEATMPLLDLLTIPANSVGQVNFGIFEWGALSFSSSIPEDLPDGTYNVSFRIFGTRQCDSAPFQTFFSNADTVVASPWEGTLKGPAVSISGGGPFTQFGGIYIDNVWLRGTDPYQVLMEIEIWESCDDHQNGEFEECFVFPQGTYEFITNTTNIFNKYYFYARTMRYYPVRMKITPTPEMVNSVYPWGMGISYLGLQWIDFDGGVGIIEGVADFPLVSFIERIAKYDHIGIETKNTFIQPGQTNQVFVNVTNPEAGEPESSLVVKPESHLLLAQNGADESADFSPQLKSAHVSVPQQNDLGIVFDVTPTSDVEIGKVNIDALVSSRGTYIYYDRFSLYDFGVPYDGPDNVVIDGTALASEQVEPGFFYVVDQQPLELSNGADTVGGEITDILLPVHNNSDWDFTITPESYLELPVEPLASLQIKTSNGIYRIQEGIEIAQSIIPEDTFIVGEVSFKVNLPDNPSGMTDADNLLTFEIVQGNSDGTISNNLVVSQDFLVPAGSPVYAYPITLQLENVKLLKGQKYYLKVCFPESGSVLVRHPDDEDIYPQGVGYYKYPFGNGFYVWAETNSDYSFSLFADRVFHQAATTLTDSELVAPQTTSLIPFRFETPVDSGMDGVYIPEVVLKGSTTTADESFAYRQEISNSLTTIAVDNTPPISEAQPLPDRTIPLTVVSWYASDELSEISTYDVQVQIDNGEWSDWILSTTNIEATYPSEAGHVYSFRVRARDEMLNLGEWCDPISTEVSLEPITKITMSSNLLLPDTFEGDTTVSFEFLPLHGYPVSSTYYEVDGGLQQEYSGPFAVSGAGTHTIRFWSVDQAGHVETPKSYTFTIVNIPPTISEGDTFIIGKFEDDPDFYHIPPVLHAMDPELSNVITWQILSGPSHGSASVQASGFSSEFTYLSELNYFGMDSFIVQASDNFGGTDTIEVRVYISSQNDCPVIGGGYNDGGGNVNITMSEDGDPTPFALTLSAIDVEGDELSWNIFISPGYGSASVQGVGESAEVAYVPEQDYHGGDFFQVQVADTSNCRDQIFVHLLIESVNDAPVILEGESVSVTMSEDDDPTPFTLTLSAEDKENDDLTWSVLTQAGHGNASLGSTADPMEVIYESDPDYFGSDSFVVEVADGQGGTDSIQVDVIIEAVNDAPVILEGESVSVTMSEDGNPTPFALTLSAEDKENDQLTWTVVTQAGHGTASLGPTTDPMEVTYEPAADYNGCDSFIIGVADGQGGPDSILINVTIEPVNDAPVILEGESVSVTMSEDGDPTPFTLTLSAEDKENDDLTWSVLTQAEHGNASLGLIADPITVVYVPNPDYYGSDSFIVEVADGQGGTDSILINVTIEPVNDAPVILEGESVSVTMSEDGDPTPFVLTLHGYDADSDTLSWSIWSDPINGVAEVHSAGNNAEIFYNPSLGFHGSDSFIVQIQDEESGLSEIIVSVEIEQRIYYLYLPFIQ